MKLDHHLSQLENAQLVLRLEEEELAFVFKHALLQNTAYESLLKQDRRRLHLHVGETLEKSYPDQLYEFAALLARHFTLAGERERAIKYSRMASQRETARYAYEEAAVHIEAALALIEEGASEIHLTLLEEAADVYRLLRNGARALELYQQALELASKLGSLPGLTAVRLDRKIIQIVTDSKWAVSIELLRQAKEVGAVSRQRLQAALSGMTDAPPQAEIVEALTALSMDAWRTLSPPDWDAAQRFAEQAVKMAETLDRPVVLSRALDALASVYDGRSRLREHLEIVLRRLEIVKDSQFDDRREKIDALRGAGQAHMYVGEYREAMPFLTEAESLADSIQAYDLLTFSMSIEAQCWLRLDQWDKVVKIEERWRGLERSYSRERVGAT